MIVIDNKLLNDINEYCVINNIENPSKYASKLLKKAFMEEKYGTKPECLEKELQKTEKNSIIEEVNETEGKVIQLPYELQITDCPTITNVSIDEKYTDNVKVINKNDTIVILEEQPKKSKKRKLN